MNKMLINIPYKTKVQECLRLLCASRNEQIELMNVCPEYDINHS